MSEYVLVTGATGFLGSYLVHALLDKDYIPVVLKRKSSDMYRIADISNRIRVYDTDDMDEAFSEQHIIAVFHTACCYGRKNESLEQIFQTNLMFSIKLLETAIRFNTDTFFNTDTLLQKYLNAYSLSKKHFVDCLKINSDKIQVINLKLEHMYGKNDSNTKFVSWIIEFVRDDVCINSLNIKMVGVGSGVKVNTFGPSHHTTEDIALLRSMPNLTLLCPASVKELPEVIESGLNFEGPVYIRIGRAFETEVFEEKVPKFEIGKSNLISEGKDLTIISTGNIIANAIEASNRLKSENVSCDIINLSSIKPLDSELILKSINKTHKVSTLEEHQKTGGIGSAIAEIIAENNLDCSFKRMGFDDKFAYEYGWHKDILEADFLQIVFIKL